jgi:uncharacterized protein YdhG (YjbR/CyaY superfamily)
MPATTGGRVSGSDTVDGYLAGLAPDRRAALEDLRARILAIVPGAAERISYRMPALTYEGRILVWYAAFADHLSLFPATDAMREELGERLTPFLSGKGTIRIDDRHPMPDELLRKIVRQRIRELSR